MKNFAANIIFVFFVVFLSSGFAQTEKDSSDSRSFSLFGYPYLFYTPETELAFGVGGLATFYLGKEIFLRPSKITLSGYYTSNQQYSLDLNPEFYFLGNRYFFSANLNYSYMIDKFYGIGADTPEIEHPEYSADIFSVNVNFQLPSLFGFTYKSGILFDYKSFVLRDKMRNPYLVNPAFAVEGQTVGVGLIWVWDSRNSIFNPKEGLYYQIKAQFFMKAIASDYDFNVYTTDLRWFVPVGEEDAVALQAYGRLVLGYPPFYELSALGGQTHMRGYFEGRYRDNNFITAQVEYRFNIWRKIGAVLFGGIGNVSKRVRDFRIPEAIFSYGFGLRYLFNAEEKVNLRADFGFGKNTSGVYFGIEEVF